MYGVFLALPPPPCPHAWAVHSRRQTAWSLLDNCSVGRPILLSSNAVGEVAVKMICNLPGESAVVVSGACLRSGVVTTELIRRGRLVSVRTQLSLESASTMARTFCLYRAALALS